MDTDIQAADDTALVIDTLGSMLTLNNNTELGLYDANGNRVADDDDGAGGLLSQLTFGLGGMHGDLSAGIYFLSVSGFNTNFGVTGFVVANTDHASKRFGCPAGRAARRRGNRAVAAK